MTRDDDHGKQLSQIIADYLQAVEAGQEPDRDKLLADHPEVAEELREFLSTHDQMHEAAGPPSPPQEDATIPPRPSLEDQTLAPDTTSGNATLGTKVRYFGDYELLDEIARGGMGVVYKARQTSLNRIVALKMILAGQLAGEEDVQRFHAEAEAAANLDHPGIVPIYEIGEHEGQHYFSMGFVEGESLANIIKERPLPPRVAVEYLKKIADAMAFAHERGVIHRDLKPANVLVDLNNEPKVTDFGLAKKLDGDSDLTATGQILGTPSYMPPEQAAGKMEEVTETADIYSLGAILYALITGRPPFQAASHLDTLLQVIEREPVAPRMLDPSLSKDLETICLKALAKEPDRRYGSASELSDDLGRYLNHEPIVARRVGPLEKAWLWRRRNPRAALGLCAAVVLLVIGGFAAREWRGRLQAAALLDNLIQASVDDVPDVTARLQPYLRWAKPRLNALSASEAASDVERRRQLHARIGLTNSDAEQHDALREALLDVSFDLEYLQVIGDALTAANANFTSDLWERMRDPRAPAEVRFRVGLVLCRYAPGRAEEDEAPWTKEDGQFLIAQYLDTNPEFHPVIRESLSLNANVLTQPLADVFLDAQLTKLQREAAAKAVVDLFPENVTKDDFDRLQPLLLLGTGEQFQILYPLVSKNAALDQDMLDLVREPPAETLGSVERVQYGKQRATAAITLLRKGWNRAELLKVLEVDDDPEAMTQFIHRCKARGVTVAELLELWDLPEAPKLLQRHALPVKDRKALDSQLFGLLLALGEYSWAQIPTDRQEQLRSQVADLFRDDKSSGVHAAAGWLLRRWGAEDSACADLAKQLDERQVEVRAGWEWHTVKLEIDVAGAFGLPRKQAFYQTYVQFESSEHQFGSPRDEPEREDNEVEHRRLVGGFWMLDREITRGEAEASSIFINITKWSPTSSHAMLAPTWYDGVRFSRWLSAELGYADSQAYAAESDLPEAEYRRDEEDETGVYNWPLDLLASGFRLPTEHEWGAGCRGGLRTAFSFGSDELLLKHYGWFEENSDQAAHVARELRPTLRGLFDMHGNAYEWCHDWYGAYAGTSSETGPESGPYRVLRGGGWGSAPRLCRSADRNRAAPSIRLSGNGFRVLRSSVKPSPAEQNKNKSRRRSREWRPGAERGFSRPRRGRNEGVAARSAEHLPGEARSRAKSGQNIHWNCTLDLDGEASSALKPWLCISVKFPARGCPESEAALNRFLNTHRVLSVDRRWVEQDENSYWAICVDYLDSTPPDKSKQSAATTSTRVDYREVLSPEEFSLYSSLREWRKDVASKEGVPVYQVFTNDQLAQVVKKGVNTKAALAQINGLGETPTAWGS